MLHKIKISFLQFSLLTLLATFGFTGVVAAQKGPDPQGAICRGANTLQVSSRNADADNECTGNEGGDPSERVNELIRQVINIFSVIVGIIAVIMIIYGGLKYITSGGDSGNIQTAKSTVIYALVGLIIVALAQIIVRFVLNTARP